MKSIYLISLTIILATSFSSAFEFDSLTLNSYSLTAITTIFKNYAKFVAPALFTLSKNLNDKVAQLQKLSNVQIIYNWPSLPAQCIPAYSIIEKQSVLQLNALKALSSSGLTSKSEQILLLQPSVYESIINAIELNIGGAATAVQGFTEHVNSLNKLVNSSYIDKTGYNLIMPVTLATEITNANKLIAVATEQIAYSFSSINEKNSTKVLTYQKFNGAIQFINAFFEYSNIAANYTEEIAVFFISGPQKFYQRAKINLSTEMITIPVTEIIKLIILPTTQLAKLYADIGYTLNSFNSVIVSIKEYS